MGLARDPEFVALLWFTGTLKVLAGLLALALVSPRARVIPGWLLLNGGWGTGALLVLYGSASWLQHGLMVTGVLPTPVGLGPTAALGHLLFWDPWWTLGGVLFLGTTWR